MLILERQQNQAVKITTKSGEVIRVVVTKFQAGKKVWLGFDAPRDILVLREEAENKTPRTREAAT